MHRGWLVVPRPPAMPFHSTMSHAMCQHPEGASRASALLSTRPQRLEPVVEAVQTARPLRRDTPVAGPAARNRAGPWEISRRRLAITARPIDNVDDWIKRFER